MKERPILFSGQMVRAILEGRKTQTRRVIKPQPEGFWGSMEHAFAGGVLQCVAMKDGKPCDQYLACPYGIPGDRVWVRERLMMRDAAWVYRADESLVLVDPKDESAMRVWAHHKERDYAPSIHMPRWASRIMLELTDVRVQRVQEITYEDILAEGWNASCDLPMTDGTAGEDARAWYRTLWDSINAKRVRVTHPGLSYLSAPVNHPHAWRQNPWVWALTFRRVA